MTPATLDYPARVRFVVSDTSGNDQHGLLWGVRSRNYSGSATAALSYEAEQMTALNGAGSVALSGASGGTVVSSTAFPASTWVGMLYTNLTAGAAPLTHAGTYRTWARCYSSAATPQFRLQWGVGALSVPTTNDPVRLPGTAAFYMLDLGTVSITPPPVGPANWYGAIQTQVNTTNDHVAIDRLFMQPLDEGAGELTYIPTAGIAPRYGPQGGTVGADDSGNGGAAAWTNPGNITSADGIYTVTTTASDQTTHRLKATGFGFAVPATATITGIQVDVLRKAVPGPVNDVSVQLVKAGTVQTTNRSSGALWPSSASYASFGGPNDLWGTTWTPTDINNSGFGAALAAHGWYSMFVDYFRITVTTLTLGFTVVQDAVIYASKTAEMRTDGMFRSDSGGTIFAPVSMVTGDLPRLPPSGLENRAVQVFIKPSRGDFDQLPDSGLDGLSVVPKIRPSYLFRP